MNLEDRTKTIISLVYGCVFPLFGIFLYTQFNYQGIHLYHDILLGYGDNILYTSFQWLYSIFKGNLITLVGSDGLLAFFKQPLMAAVFTWFLTGFFIAVVLKNLKRSTLVAVLCNVILIGTFLIFVGICQASYNTGTLIFETELFVFLEGLITAVVFTFLGNLMGYFAGRD